MVETSAIERIRALDAERAKLFGQAKEEALRRATDAVSDLIALGLNYSLHDGDAKEGGNKHAKKTFGAECCPICGFQTSPSHDKRSHRGQKTKVPFTAAILKQKGFVKV
jgi:hypothetical protein